MYSSSVLNYLARHFLHVFCCAKSHYNLTSQSGRGPRAQPVQGLVRIGELLTAVVTVQGDTEFDLVVRNCVATDGTPENRITLSDK